MPRAQDSVCLLRVRYVLVVILVSAPLDMTSTKCNKALLLINCFQLYFHHISSNTV